jgi:hypothetical protein
MFKISLLALLLSTAVAHAQAPDAGAPAAAAPAAVMGDDPFQKGTIGLSFPFTLLSNVAGSVEGLAVAEPIPTVNVLYFMSDKAAVDLIGGINLHDEQTVDATTMMTTSTTVFGFSLGAGYRMYKHDGKMHSFVEPSVALFMGDTSRSQTFGLRGGFQYGLERLLTDWMSLSGAIGGAIIATNKFDDIQLVPTANLAATFYFK